MLRIVVDTNVIVSAYVHQKFSALVYIDCYSQHSLFTSQWMLDELDATLDRKFKFTFDKREIILSSVKGRSLVISPNTIRPTICSDPDDNNVLQLCESANADMLITGDSALLQLDTFKNCKILSPRAYYDSTMRISNS